MTHVRSRTSAPPSRAQRGVRTGMVSAARVALRHRLWGYLALLALLLGALGAGVVSEAPAAQAASPATTVSASLTGGVRTAPEPAPPPLPASPAQWLETARAETDLGEASRYLLVSRWRNVSSIGTPDIGLSNVAATVGAGQSLIGRVMLLVAAFTLYLVGFLLVQVLQLQLLPRAANTVDYLVANLGFRVFTDEGSGDVDTYGIGILGLVLLMLVGLTAWHVTRGGVQKGARTFVVGITSLVALGLMTVQAGENDHTGGDPKKPGSAFSQDQARAKSQPRDWAGGSPGWFIAGGNQVAGLLSGVLAGALNGFTETVDDVSGIGDYQYGCGDYVRVMGEVFDQTQAAKDLGNNAKLLKQYSRLVEQVYIRPYVLAGYGESAGASSAWCRSAEVQAGSTPADQAMLAREAGLYREVVGVKNGAEGSVLLGDGNWRFNGSPRALQSFFGPYSMPSSQEEAAAYFAACQWQPDQPVSFNSEWSKVQNADQNRFLWFENQTGPNGPQDCLNVATGQGEHTKQKGVLEVGFDQNQTKVEKFKQGKPNEADAHWPTKIFWYHEDRGGVFGLLGVGGSSSTAYFQPALDAGQTEAYTYYQTVHGMQVQWAMVLGGCALVFAFVTAKFMLPIVLGGVVAQLMGILALLFLVFVLLALVVPTRATLRTGALAARTVVWSFLANTLFVTVLSILMLVVAFFRVLFLGGDATALVGILQIAVGTLLAFLVTRVLVSRVLGMDLGTVAGAMKSSAALSGRPLLQNAGYATPSVFASGGGQGGRWAAEGSALGALGGRYRRQRDAMTEQFREKRNQGLKVVSGVDAIQRHRERVKAAGLATERAKRTQYSGTHAQDPSLAPQRAGAARSETNEMQNQQGRAAAQAARGGTGAAARAGTTAGAGVGAGAAAGTTRGRSPADATTGTAATAVGTAHGRSPADASVGSGATVVGARTARLAGVPAGSVAVDAAHPLARYSEIGRDGQRYVTPSKLQRYAGVPTQGAPLTAEQAEELGVAPGSVVLDRAAPRELRKEAQRGLKGLGDQRTRYASPEQLLPFAERTLEGAAVGAGSLDEATPEQRVAGFARMREARRASLGGLAGPAGAVSAQERLENQRSLAQSVQNLRPEYDRARQPLLRGTSAETGVLPGPEALTDPQARALAATAAGLAKAPGASPLRSDRALVAAQMKESQRDGAVSSTAPQLVGVDDVTRVATHAAMFPVASPVTRRELNELSPTDRKRYLDGDLDRMQGTIPGSRWYALPPTASGAAPVPGMGRDPRTGMFVPEALVRSGTPSVPFAETTAGGLQLSGVARGGDGRYATLQPVSNKTLGARVLDAATPPPGVSAATWTSWQDLRGWMDAEALDPVAHPSTTWPVERQVQLASLAAAMPDVHRALGHPLPQAREEQLLRQAPGLAPARELSSPFRTQASLVPSANQLVNYAAASRQDLLSGRWTERYGGPDAISAGLTSGELDAREVAPHVLRAAQGVRTEDPEVARLLHNYSREAAGVTGGVAAGGEHQAETIAVASAARAAWGQVQRPDQQLTPARRRRAVAGVEAALGSFEAPALATAGAAVVGSLSELRTVVADPEEVPAERDRAYVEARSAVARSIVAPDVPLAEVPWAGDVSPRDVYGRAEQVANRALEPGLAPDDRREIAGELDELTLSQPPGAPVGRASQSLRSALAQADVDPVAVAGSREALDVVSYAAHAAETLDGLDVPDEGEDRTHYAQAVGGLLADAPQAVEGTDLQLDLQELSRVVDDPDASSEWIEAAATNVTSDAFLDADALGVASRTGDDADGAREGSPDADALGVGVGARVESEPDADPSRIDPTTTDGTDDTVTDDEVPEVGARVESEPEPVPAPSDTAARRDPAPPRARPRAQRVTEDAEPRRRTSPPTPGAGGDELRSPVLSDSRVTERERPVLGGDGDGDRQVEEQLHRLQGKVQRVARRVESGARRRTDLRQQQAMAPSPDRRGRQVPPGAPTGASRRPDAAPAAVLAWFPSVQERAVRNAERPGRAPVPSSPARRNDGGSRR